MDKTISKRNRSEYPTILVIGGSGKLGRLIVRHFHAQKYMIRIATRNPLRAMERFNHLKNVEVVFADLSMPSTLKGVANDCAATIFAAGAKRPCYACEQDDISEFNRINTDSLKHVGLEVLRSGNQPLIHLGSMFALGVLQNGELTENTSPRPTTPFELSEFKGERILVDMHVASGLDCRIMRLPPVTDTSPIGFLLNVIYLAGCDLRWHEVFEQKKNTKKPLISPSDFLTGLDCTLKYGKSGGIYQFTSGDYSLMEIQHIVRCCQRDTPIDAYLSWEYLTKIAEFKRFLISYITLDVMIDIDCTKNNLQWTPKADIL